MNTPQFIYKNLDESPLRHEERHPGFEKHSLPEQPILSDAES